jgi:hypothetical protein
MGTQGLSGHGVSGGRGDVRATSRPITILAVSLAILPLAAGCSGSSLPSFGSSNQQSTVPPPPTGSVAATGQPAYAPPPGQPAAQAGAYAAAPPAQAAAASEGATVGSFTSSYVNFIKAFRDPDPDSATPSSAVRPPAYAQQSAAAPQQNANVPHPPSTYVPAGQPYVPPQGQPAYAPPQAQQNYAAPPPPAQQNPPRSGQQSSAASSTKQAKAARASSQQNAAAAPAQPAVAAAAPAAQRDYSDSLPYPKQSLADVFRGSTETQTQTVPRPPSTYTPSGQPYTPGQAANGATGGAAAAAPPAAQNPSDSLPYPKQSLFEVFSNDK